MPRNLRGNADYASAGQEPAELPASTGCGAGFGAFGPILVDGFGARVGLALELRARRLLDRLHRHHPESAAHSLRVAEVTMGMWRTAPGLLGGVETALLGSLLHDVGKLCVPHGILASPHLLTGEERALVSSHAAQGAEMLLEMGFPEAIAAVARGHHERWAGGGYPTSRPARSLPPIVRAVAVADAFDAMTDPGREYRASLSQREALREVAACAGTHFDPVAATILADSLSDGRAAPAEDRPWRAPAMPSFRPEPAARADLAVVH